MTIQRRTGKRVPEKDLAAMTPHEAAAYWFVRFDAEEMSAADRNAFDAWLSSSEAHARAYEQARAMWSDFEDAADSGELRALRVAALATTPSPQVWPRAAAMAGGFVATALLGAFVWYSVSEPPIASSAAVTRNSQYLTAHNQRSTVTLPDGTLVSMNLDTTLDTDLSGQQRRIHLIRGQAFFDVAKDPHRPFIVTAADRQIHALGTQFDVRLDDDRVEVVLLEGKVSVARDDTSLLDKLMTRRAQLELAPGQRMVATVGKMPSVTQTNAAKVTSWREGWVVFEDETVEAAISELNRYSDKPIAVLDEDVKRMRLSGVFRIGQPDRFGAIMQELLPISVERGASGETVLVAKHNEEH